MALIHVLQHLLQRYRDIPQDGTIISFDMDWIQHNLPQSNMLVNVRDQIPPIQITSYIQLLFVSPFLIDLFNSKKEDARHIADQAIKTIQDAEITQLERAQQAVYETLFVIHNIQVPFSDPEKPKSPVNQHIHTFIRPKTISSWFWAYTVLIMGAMVIATTSGLSYLNQTKSVAIEVPNAPIEHIYGTDPDLSAIRIEETNYLEFKTIKPVQLSMISNFDRFKVGVQRPTINYLGVSESFDLTTYYQLETPQPYIENSTLKWNDIENASSYNIQFNNVFFRNVATTSLPLVSETTISGAFNFKVQALTSEGYYMMSPYSNAVQGNKLTTISAISYEAGQIRWSPVQGANQYHLEINGIGGYQSNTHSIDFSLPTSTVDIYISASHTTSGVIASRSSLLRLYRLESVTGLSLSNNTLSWNPVNDAVNYDVLVNQEVFFNDIVETSVSFAALNAGIYEVEVIANSGSSSVASSTSGPQSYLLKTALTLNDNILSWPAINGATKYELYTGNTKFKEQFNSNSVDLRNETLLEGNQEIKLKVIKESSGLFQAFTPSIEVQKYAAIVSINYNGTSLNWSYPETGVTYELRINNGNLITTTSKSYQVTLSSGLNSIEIRVRGSGSTTISSNLYVTDMNIGGRLTSPVVTIERHPTQTNIWYIRVSPVAGADYYTLIIKAYTTEDVFTTLPQETLTEATTMSKTFVSSGYVKIVVEVVARSTYPLVFDDSLPTISTKNF